MNPKVETLRTEIASIDAELRSIHEAAGEEALSAEQQARWSDHETRRTAKVAELEAFEARLAAIGRAAQNPQNRIPGDGSGPEVVIPGAGYEAGTDVRTLSAKDAREMALRALEDRDRTSHLEKGQVDEVERLARRDTDIARRLLVTENDEYRSAWFKLMTDPAPILTAEEARAVQAQKLYRAMSEGTSSAGGYGIPVLIDPSIILTSQGTVNPFLTIARQVNTNTNVWKGVTSDGITWQFQAESAAAADASPTLAQPVVNVNTARGFVPYTIEVGEDYPGFAQEMATLLASGYDELLVNKFTTGSGTNEPNGIQTALDADATAQVQTATTAVFAAADVYSVFQALAQRFRRNASWLMSIQVESLIREMATANVYHAVTVTLPAGAIDQLYGRPVFEDPYMPTNPTATGNDVLIVGDFNDYIVARRAGMSVELVPHVFDQATGRPNGQRGWFAYARIGGNVASTKAFKLLKLK